MGTALPLLARFGPPLLVIMGIALCLAYPALQRGRWAFLAAFLILGVPVSVAAFLAARPLGAANTQAARGAAAPVRSVEITGGDSSKASSGKVLVRVAGTEVVTGSERRTRPNRSREGTREGGPVYVIVRQPHQGGNRSQRGVRSSSSGTRAVVVAIPSQAHAGASSEKPTTPTDSKIPPNTLACTGFTRDPEGTWEAGDDTQPFNVGTDTNYTVRDEGPIRPGWLSIGTVDLYALLNAKCGGSSKSTR